MHCFENTALWEKTLGEQKRDKFKSERALLRHAYLNFRDKAKILAGEINRDLPEFTVHDIGHIDGLWETAELIVGSDYDINAAEAFVLGCAFLIHDLGMGVVAYPEGLGDIKKSAIWTDTVASILKAKFNRKVSKNEIEEADLSVSSEATKNVLRILHAQQAEKLALASWKDQKGEQLFLFENSELRHSYGSIIGLIAHSHWWSIEELEQKLPVKNLGAPSQLPQEWTVDPIKLACILRASDAAQIDDRRAPHFLRTVRKLDGYSDQHWNFQGKLFQPQVENARLIYTSKSAFTTKEIESWWLCFDTIQMIDKELQSVDSLLSETHRKRFKVIGVTSANDAMRLSECIKVDGWHPIDTKIRVSNVAKLVYNLGGVQLYGDTDLIPLRELIQNGADAIRARRTLEGLDYSFGEVNVIFGKDEIGYFFELEDNGIGMSKEVLTNPFLDFGQTFWGSSLMHQEFPGLESKGFQSTGKFGIGFYSIFMWGDKVTVSTRRYTAARENTLLLEFRNGVSSRPILRKAAPEEMLKEGGTKVKVWIKNRMASSNKTELNRWLISDYEQGNYDSIFPQLKMALEGICPAIDVNINLALDTNPSQKIIYANDWKTLVPSKFYDRLPNTGSWPFKTTINNVKLIKDDDENVVGRVGIYLADEECGVVTAGGLASSYLFDICGILDGEVQQASRENALPSVSDKALRIWATRQADLMPEKYLRNIDKQIKYSNVIRRCGGFPKNLMLAFCENDPVHYAGVKNIASLHNEILLLRSESLVSYDSNYLSMFDFVSNLIIHPSFIDTLISGNGIWPKATMTEYRKTTYVYSPIYIESIEYLIIQALSEEWNCSIEDILVPALVLQENTKYQSNGGIVIGTWNGEYERRPDVLVLTRPKSSKTTKRR